MPGTGGSDRGPLNQVSLLVVLVLDAVSTALVDAPQHDGNGRHKPPGEVFTLGHAHEGLGGASGATGGVSAGYSDTSTDFSGTSEQLTGSSLGGVDVAQTSFQRWHRVDKQTSLRSGKRRK